MYIFGTDTTDLPKVATDLSTNTYSPATLTEYTRYYWKVVAKDNHGAEISSELWTFITTHIPNQPSDPNPSNGATDVSTNPTLSWTCSDPDEDPLVYDIYFGTNPDPPLIVSNHTGTSYQSGTPQYDATYYWKVVAKDGKGGVTESPVWKFTTEMLHEVIATIDVGKYPGGVAVNPDTNETYVANRDSNTVNVIH
jgi:hypothetical protein